MTESPDDETPLAPPDEPLNAEPIIPYPAAAVAATVKKSAGSHGKKKGRYRELSWALVGGIFPFAVALIVHGVIAGFTVDPANLGYSLFALSLAAIVRIVSHGSGKDLLPLLMLFGFLQTALALFYSGSFDATLPPSKGDINNASKVIAPGATPTASRLRSISELLTKIADDDHPPSYGGYICLAATGLMSTLVLVRYWSPTISESTEEA